MPTVKVGFSPLDQQLKLVRHSWTPETIQQALRLGAQIPSLRRAAQSFEALTKMPLSKSSLGTLVLEYGGRLVEQQEAEAQQAASMPEKEEVVRPLAVIPDAPVMAVAMDGVMLHVRGEGWKEVKVVAISAVESVSSAEGAEPQVQLSHHSYRAGLWEAASFAKQQWAEACRRGLARARQVVCVSDAAAWIWSIVLTCYAPCVEIIDWWHAVEKLWGAANAFWGQGSEAAKVWVEQLKDLLWAGKLRALVHQLRLCYPRGAALPEAFGRLLSYLYHHRWRMHYQACRKAGYPTGSGTVESACKVVVQERMTQAGMRWSRPGAQAMLALRSVLLSERWEADWPSMFPVLAPP